MIFYVPFLPKKYNGIAWFWPFLFVQESLKNSSEGDRVAGNELGHWYDFLEIYIISMLIWLLFDLQFPAYYLYPVPHLIYLVILVVCRFVYGNWRAGYLNHPMEEASRDNQYDITDRPLFAWVRVLLERI